MALAGALVGLTALTAAAQGRRPAGADWPQWRGPDRSGLSRDTGLMKSWPAGGPRLAWKAPGLGGGFGQCAVVGGRIYGVGLRGAEEIAWALDAATGRPVWSAPFARPSNPDPGGRGGGPRSTPTVDGDRLYVEGVGGDVACLDLATGKVRWQKSLVREFGGRVPQWGFSESPLVDGEKLIVTPGGGQATLVALNKMTGAPIWRAQVPGGDSAEYSSPIVADVDGQRQYIQFLKGGVVGVSARDGGFLWRYNQPANGVANCSTPLYADHIVFAASGYGKGGGAARLAGSPAGTTATELYKAPQMKNHHGNMVLVNGFVYGFDENNLTCINLKTGEVKWFNRSVGKGSIAYADGMLYCRSERGSVALVEANPQSYVERGRFDQPERSNLPAWANPVIAGGRLYLRDQENLFAYDLRGGGAASAR